MARSRYSSTPGPDARTALYGHDRDNSSNGYSHHVSRQKENNPIFPPGASSAKEHLGSHRQQRPPQVRERSLSPYSKRLALTQSMAMVG